MSEATKVREAPAEGDYAEILCGSWAGCVGRVRAVFPADGDRPARVRLTLQGGDHIVVPLADVEKV